jgi:RES domain-containing protein
MLAQNIANALRPGTNFASVAYITQVKTAAAHKARAVQKHTTANVQLFANIADARAVFEAALKRSAAKYDNSADAVAGYELQENWFEHTACFSIVQHKSKPALYLYAIYNSAESNYTIDGVAATKAEVAALLTPAAARDLLEPSATVVNKTHNIEHDVRVRVIALDNVLRVTVNKQTLTA